MNQIHNYGQTLNRILGGYWVAQAIYVAAELGVADVLGHGPLTIVQLAQTAGAQPEPLYHVLRALAGVGIFAVPAADACVLRHVIHDWPDEEAAVILRNCAAAMGADGRVIVVETSSRLRTRTVSANGWIL